MIGQLSPEVLEKILYLCSPKDILNVACCSKHFRTSVTHLLWMAVKIPCLRIGSSLDIFEKLKHTVSLNLHQKHNDCKDDLDESHCDDIIKKTFNFGFNYRRLLSYCNPEKLRKLRIEGVVAEEGIHYAIEVLHYIKVFGLVCVSMDNWKPVTNLQNMRKLHLTSCNINDNEMKDILNGNRLEELCIRLCPRITNDTLLCISRLDNLTSLTFCANGTTTFQIDLIGELKNLVCLFILYTRVLDASLLHLCQCLKRLKVLKLHGFGLMGITDHGLSEVHLLTALTELQLFNCRYITSNCFTYISSLVSIRNLTVSAEICRDNDNSTAVSDAVSQLNNITTLKKITIAGTANKDEGLVASIFKVLCSGKKVGIDN